MNPPLRPILAPTQATATATARGAVGRALLAAAVGLGALLASCGHQVYEARPLEPAATQARWLVAETGDDALRQALAAQGLDVSRWPLPAWDGAGLTGLALQRHPDLAVARSTLRAAEAERAVARQRAGQEVGVQLEHHSTPGHSTSPWSLGLALDSLVSGSARRTAQADEADALADEAVAQAAQAAWDQRQRVLGRLRELFFALQHRDRAQAALQTRRDLLAAQQSRLAQGAAGAGEVLQARLAETEAAQQLDAAGDAEGRARQALAEAVGLSGPALATLRLRFDEAQAGPPSVSADPLQRAALLHRLDLRAAVARHAAADAVLRAEIARQWPEIVLQPGAAWDQGDRRWSLGVALSLPPGGDNRAAIDRARARRELEAGRVAALQWAALARLEVAGQAEQAARTRLDAAEAGQRLAREQQDRARRRLAAGDTDRLEVLKATLAVQDADRRQIDAAAARGAALAALEDALQQPLWRAANAPNHSISATP